LRPIAPSRNVAPQGFPGRATPAAFPPDVFHGNQATEAGPPDSGTPLIQKWQLGHSALAWHPDATEVWAVWNAIERSEAEELALAACNLVMDNGCTIAIAATGGTTAFGLGPDGYLRAAWADGERKAKESFDRQCAAAGVDCLLLQTFTSTHVLRPVEIVLQRTRAHLPETRGKAAYGAVASPESNVVGTRWQGHAWLVTGAPTYAAATDKVLAHCKAATGTECKLDAHGVNSNIFLYTTGDDFFFWSLGLSRKDADASLKKICRQHHKGKRCTITAFYDMETVRDEVVLLGYSP